VGESWKEVRPTTTLFPIFCFRLLQGQSVRSHLGLTTTFPHDSFAAPDKCGVALIMAQLTEKEPPVSEINSVETEIRRNIRESISRLALHSIDVQDDTLACSCERYCQGDYKVPQYHD
jgi:hypothetical protein